MISMPNIAGGPTSKSMSGKDGKFPKIRSADEGDAPDMTLMDLDFDAYLARLKKNLDGNSANMWKEIIQLAHQVKSSRELLLIGSNLFSSKSKGNIIDRLIDATHTVLNAERVFLFEIDQTGRNLVLMYTKDKNIVGSKIPIEVGIEGDVFISRKSANVEDASQDKRFFPGFESKSGARAKYVLCVPVIFEGAAIGVLEVVNRFVPKTQKSPRSGAIVDAGTRFTEYEEKLLHFISTNAALFLRQQSCRNTPVNMNGANLSSAKTFSRAISPSQDPKIHNIMEKAYIKLDAERVSVFSFNATTKNLVCIVSQDIKGFTIAADRGFAGLSFTSIRVVNVADAKGDSRHNKDADMHAGFTTRNLLCAPIVDASGTPIGVIQAVNKKSGPNFTAVDEETIVELCQNMAHFLSESPSAGAYSVFNQEGLGVAMTKSTSRLMCSSTLQEVAGLASHMMKKITAYDFATFYVLHGEEIIRIVPSECDADLSTNTVAAAAIGPSTSMSDRILDTSDETAVYNKVPQQFRDAFQFGTVLECKPSPAGGPTQLLRDVELYRSYVIPLVGSRSYEHNPGAVLLLVGSTKARAPALSSFTMEAVRAYSEGVAVAVAHVSEIQHLEESTRVLKQNFHLINNTLGTLNEFIILLNADGNLIASNKILEDLFGDEHGSIVDGMHYTQWLKEQTAKELFNDISEVLRDSEVKEKTNVRLVSKVHPHGISMDFMVSPIASAENTEKTRLPIGAETSSKKSVLSRCAAVVVVIRLLNSKTDVTPHAFLEEDGSFSGMNAPTAHGVAEAANEMLAKLQTSFELDANTSEQLKVVTGLLANASRALSISNANYSSIQKAIQSVHLELVDPSLTLPDNIFDWEFNVLEISDRLLLCSIIGRLYQKMFADLEVDLSVNPSTMARFIMEVSKNYHDRPFHNFQHATCVTHFTYMLLTNCNAAESLAPHQMFAVLTSAIVHDVDHPGNTNTFEINSQSELALRYNDKSVLENHHCATAFRIMRKSQMQILGGMDSPTSVDVRKLIISCVMATDMAVHFELIDETKKRAVEGWNLTEPKEQSLLGMVLLHAADLSNPVRPFHMTKEWAQRISIEFNDQVDKEQKLGMPVLGYMRTPDQKAFCKNETGFASFVVAPMWRAVASVFPQLHFLVDQLDSNLVTWKATLDSIVDEETKAEVAKNASNVNEK